MMDWIRTRPALQHLQELLKCCSCDQLLKDPCSFESCNHFFCRVCAVELVNTHSSCRKCSLRPCEVRDVKESRQMALLIDTCAKLIQITSTSAERANTDEENLQVDYHHSATECTLPSRNDDAHTEQSETETYVFKSPPRYTDSNNGNSPCKQNGIDPMDIEEGNSIDQVCDLTTLPLDKPVSKSSHAPPVEALLFMKVDEQDCEEALDSPPASQFSRVLTDDDVKRGAEKNPGRNFKKPKTTYGKKKTSVFTSVKAKGTASENWYSDDSVFAFTSENSSKPRTKSSRRASGRNVDVLEQMLQDDAERMSSASVGEDDPNMCGKKKVEKGSTCETSKENTNSPLRQKNTASRKAIENLDTTSDSAGTSTGGTCGKENTSEDNDKAAALDKTRHAAERKQKQEETKIQKRITKRNKKGETNLHVACIKGKYPEVMELLKLGSDPNTKDFAGYTPLHEACNHGYLDIMSALLAGGAVIDLVGGVDNDTPLHDAVANSQVEATKLLISKGAPKDIRNSLNLLPLDYAKQISDAVTSQEMVDVLSEEPPAAVDTSNVSVCDIEMITSFIENQRKIITCTSLMPSEKETVEWCCQLTGVEFHEDSSNEVTHLVCGITDENHTQAKGRTLKYLQAIVEGKWIVSFKWITDSLIARSLLPENEYELTGCSVQYIDVPRIARVNRIKQLPRLFTGCSFFLSGNFGPSLSREFLSELIRVGGGKLVSREPKANDVDPLIVPVSPQITKMNLHQHPVQALPLVAYHAPANTAASHIINYILYEPKLSSGQRRVFSPVLTTAPVAWLLDCISSFQILDVRDEQEQKDVQVLSQ